MKRRYFLAFFSSLLLALLIGWQLPQRGAIAQANRTILVSAAASLQDALEEIKPLFEEANPGIRVNYNFGSSGALQQQIQQGAPADVFFSAGIPQMDALEQDNLLLEGSRQNLLSNRLVLIVPINSTLELSDFQDLTNSSIERISVGEFRSVPAGQYTEQVFSSLGILEDLQPKLVFANNVRGVLAAVESGNVDAGVVYSTDARISDQVRVVATADAELHTPITYPIAIIRDRPNTPAAEAFVEYLTGDSAMTIFEDFGFSRFEAKDAAS